MHLDQVLPVTKRNMLSLELRVQPPLYGQVFDVVLPRALYSGLRRRKVRIAFRCDFGQDERSFGKYRRLATLPIMDDPGLPGKSPSEVAGDEGQDEMVRLDLGVEGMICKLLEADKAKIPVGLCFHPGNQPVNPDHPFIGEERAQTVSDLRPERAVPENHHLPLRRIGRKHKGRSS